MIPEGNPIHCCVGSLLVVHRAPSFQVNMHQGAKLSRKSTLWRKTTWTIEKGLRDRNSPTCTLSQIGYGAVYGRGSHMVGTAAACKNCKVIGRRNGSKPCGRVAFQQALQMRFCLAFMLPPRLLCIQGDVGGVVNAICGMQWLPEERCS